MSLASEKTIRDERRQDKTHVLHQSLFLHALCGASPSSVIYCEGANDFGEEIGDTSRLEQSDYLDKTGLVEEASRSLPRKAV